MENPPLVSIIIPTYNRSSLLKRSIESVMNQTFGNWELIVVDDGSTIDIQNQLTVYLTDKRLKILKKENSGAADSRNRGVELAGGEYIVFLDSDDEAKENWLEEFFRQIVDAEQPLGVIFCGYEKWQNNEMLFSKLPQDLGPIVNSAIGTYLAGCYLLKKEIFLEVGGFDIELKSGHHTELLLRVLPFCFRNHIEISSINSALVKIHIHEGERIRTNHKYIYLGTKGIFDKHLSLFNKSKSDKSNYLKIIGYNASALGLKKEAYDSYYQSFKVKPTLGGFFRVLKYKLKNLI